MKNWLVWLTILKSVLINTLDFEVFNLMSIKLAVSSCINKLILYLNRLN